MTESLFSTTELETASGLLAGFRLDRFELFNWGTFDRKVWTLHAQGDNTLLTGDIGSGKSTIVDGITTLLVPSNRAQYNRAAGADTRERTLRSYVQGHYSSERNEVTGKSRPVGLRPDPSSYSVLLGVFRNATLDTTVSLAVVLWITDGNTSQPPERFYALADHDLTIQADFTNFGTDIAVLRRRIRTSGVREFTSFTEYGREFRRALGIPSEQAMDLFHQTISMKAVGDLDEFVRQHMLERFDVQPKIDALITHFEDLTKAHDAVRKARDQLDALDPILHDGARFDEVTEHLNEIDADQSMLSAFIASGKKAHLSAENDRIAVELEHLDAQVDSAAERIESLQSQLNIAERRRDGLGGGRLNEIDQRMPDLNRLRDERTQRADDYRAALASAGLPPVDNAEQFVARRHEQTALADELRQQESHTNDRLAEQRVFKSALGTEAKLIREELLSLQDRRNKIPSDLLRLRQMLAGDLRVNPDDMPFIGELVQVAAEHSEWEPAAERLLHGFALSLVVPHEHYASVSAWVNGRHLGQRLVYLHVPATPRPEEPFDSAGALLLHKLELKPGTPLLPWLRREVARRADYVCAETLEEFRRAPRAITREGQIKHNPGRHEKDDRRRVDDRAHFVLGWSNQNKIDALLEDAQKLAVRLSRIADDITGAETELCHIRARQDALTKLSQFATWSQVDWHSVAAEILALQTERNAIVANTAELADIEQRIETLKGDAKAATDHRLELGGKRAVANDEIRRNEDEIERCERLLVDIITDRLDGFERLDERSSAHELRVANRWDDLREHLGASLGAEQTKLLKERSSVTTRIQNTMDRFRTAWRQDVQDLDASVDALGGYRELQRRLATDDLPRFEAEFKSALNENTIREVAMFRAMLIKNRDDIKSRIRTINASLVGIDYNRDTYIELEPRETANTEIKQFQRDLAEATDSSLAVDSSEQYSEEKFLQVSRLIERFRGRDGQTEIDRIWTKRVTDVREWFVFSASEKSRVDDSVREHYDGSGGKSGGQKEKLAYTILAASLAYQFKLEGDRAAKSFRFVVIDEAFGRGSDASTRFGMELFGRLGLQLLIVTPLQKIRVIEPYVAAVGFVDNETGSYSRLHSMTISEYHERRARFAATRIAENAP